MAIHPARRGVWFLLWEDRERERCTPRSSGYFGSEDDEMPNDSALPSGWWASRSPGATMANALTTPELTDRGGGGAFHSARVEVAPVRDPLGAGPHSASHPAEVS